MLHSCTALLRINWNKKIRIKGDYNYTQRQNMTIIFIQIVTACCSSFGIRGMACAYYPAKWYFTSVHLACDHAGPQNMCPLTHSAHSPTAAITQQHVIHLSSQDDSHSENGFCRASEVRAWNVSQRPWYHHMLSGWVEISYVSSQFVYGVSRWECLKFNYGTGSGPAAWIKLFGFLIAALNRTFVMNNSSSSCVPCCSLTTCCRYYTQIQDYLFYADNTQLYIDLDLLNVKHLTPFLCVLGPVYT